MGITYEINPAIEVEGFIALLRSSTLAERRPVDNLATIRSMLKHANLLICAREGGQLVGIARSVTDFDYCCYLSDLAVDETYQQQGIGRELIRLTRQQLGPKCKLILLSAPAAVDYYPKLGFEKHPQAWLLSGEERLVR
ncbi:MAG: GNAT family N-acetyltransferase [Candidatus Polarisedimenticolaceae bacterium]|nr:GNAT family N-acetyltransferase [Candidatus Polarisedimenticolaceae bacterium]